jgi:hypothetical protein
VSIAVWAEGTIGHPTDVQFFITGENEFAESARDYGVRLRPKYIVQELDWLMSNSLSKPRYNFFMRGIASINAG